MLIEEAVAQVPNAQATVDATTTFYLNQGVLGATIVGLSLLLVAAGLVIRHLYNDLKAVNATTLADRERLIEALNKVAAGDERDRDLLAAMKATLDTRTQAIGDLSQQVALSAQETRHGFNNVSQSLSGIVEAVRELLQYARGRIGGAP